MSNFTIDVVIPVYRPGEELRQLLVKLKEQTVMPTRILLVNTEQEFFKEDCIQGLSGIEVVHIRKMEFDHGGTRHRAASTMHGDLILFMTQDAVPTDEKLLEELSKTFEDPQVCAAYARQLPREDSSMLERFTRSFNYDEISKVKTAKDLPQMGIKTFFCSNVCAMYRRNEYVKLGGFERHTIFNEDMILAGRIIQDDKAVAYCAEAKVVHSHNYTGRQQFHRNFDLGVSQAQHPEIFAMARSENEGFRMVMKMTEYLVRNGKLNLIPVLIWQTLCKYTGYQLGKNYRKLPRNFIMNCTMNQEYWNS